MNRINHELTVNHVTASVVEITVCRQYITLHTKLFFSLLFSATWTRWYSSITTVILLQCILSRVLVLLDNAGESNGSVKLLSTNSVGHLLSPPRFASESCSILK
jgi:hypothetical protein